MAEDQMNLGFWDIMSRYRKSKNRIHDYQRVDSDPVKERSRVPRLALIAVGRSLLFKLPLYENIQ